MKRKGTFTVLLCASAVVVTVAWAGHELPIYPSFYPHEIDIQTLSPEQAAYIGVPVEGPFKPDTYRY